jgi:hypothetical protein
MRSNVHKINLEASAKVIPPNEAYASVNAENDDVMYIGFTLCHEGANSKGDRFTLDELKRSWQTIPHKPINWEHDEPNIGVVLDSVLKVPSDDGTVGSIGPAQIDCVGALWRLKYPEFSNLVSKGSIDGTLKVSMEAYFTGADYVIGDFDEVIPETEASEDFHSLLGTYFNGKFVSRALKDVIFGGAGITAAPADKDAKIWACASNKSDEEYHEYLHDAYEGKKISVMSKELIIAEHDKVTRKLIAV